MISYLQTIPFSNYFKSLIPIITFYYRQVVSKQQFQWKLFRLIGAECSDKFRFLSDQVNVIWIVPKT